MHVHHKIFVAIFMLHSSISAFCQADYQVEHANEKLNQFVNVRDFCISDDSDEIYFTIQSPFQEISKIAYMKFIGGKWSDPQLISFSGQFSDMEPFLSPDQTKLFFASDRPLNRSSPQKKDFDIWYVSRDNKDGDWSDPVNAGSPVNSPNDEFYPSISANNNLYFTADLPDGMGKDDIYVCTFKNGLYSPAAILDKNINSDGYEFNAFISRNEDFMIYTKYNADGGLGSGDLYISMKDIDGKWQSAINLGAGINSKYMEYCPFYDEKLEILYFTSRRNNIQPQNFRNIQEFNQYIEESESGLSKIYKVKFKTGQ